MNLVKYLRISEFGCSLNYKEWILRWTTTVVRLLGKISQYSFEQWWHTWPCPLMWPSAVPPTQIKRSGIWSPCWLLFNQLTQICSCACIVPAVLHCCNTSWDKCHCPSETQSFSHNAVKVTDVQEAAAGGRSLEANGLVVGVISSSSAVHVLLKLLWTLKLDQPNLIPLTCCPPFWMESDLLPSFFCCIIKVCLFLFWNYKLHAGSSSKWSCHRHLCVFFFLSL